MFEGETPVNRQSDQQELSDSLGIGFPPKGWVEMVGFFAGWKIMTIAGKTFW